MNLLISTVAAFLFISIVSLQHKFIAADTEPSIYNLFAVELLSAINENKSTQNIVYSPESIYNVLAVLYLSSRDRTAEELGRALKVNQAEDLFISNTFNKPITKANKQLIIRNGVRANNMTDKANAMLLNEIQLQAKWLRLYRCETSQLDCSKYILSKSTKFPDLNATVFEMLFEQPDISMMIIRPNEASGLQTLENRLKDIDLNYISSRMRPEIVNVPPPKFRIELNIDLNGALQKMGCVSLFEENPNLSRSFKHLIPHRIANVQHKIYFSVNETGLYATGYTYNDHDDKIEGPLFRAKYPFIFFVRSKTEVLFAGHVAEF